MVTELIVAILMIAAMPVFAQAQKPSAAIVTHADVRKVLEVIKGDKAKTLTYCDMVTLGHELAAADEKKADELGEKTGSRICRVNGRVSGHRPGFRGRSRDEFDVCGAG
jgi:hypothetical protein